MRLALLDPFCGISGNMMLGAMIDAGLDSRLLEESLRLLPLRGWRLEVGEVFLQGLRGTLVEVEVPAGDRPRRFAEIADMIGSSSLPPAVSSSSVRAFDALARAEAEAHGCAVEEVHFHEVGAVDAILDIVGAFAGLDILGVDEVRSTPVATGCGTVECAHGMLPVPAPATALLLRGVPCRRGPVEGELTTPTGAAIVRTAVSDWEDDPRPWVPESVGMGAGSSGLPCPDFLRLILARRPGGGGAAVEQVCELVTLVDDMDPRVWPELERTLVAAGALDFYLVQCIGRKGRPAVEATVICRKDDAAALTGLLFSGTPTLGIRSRIVERSFLDRQVREMSTRFGSIRVKVAGAGGGISRAEPEFSDCAAAALAAGLPVETVLAEARAAARAMLDGGKD